MPKGTGPRGRTVALQRSRMRLGRDVVDCAEFDDLAALRVHLGRLKVERDIDRVTHQALPQSLLQDGLTAESAEDTEKDAEGEA